MLVDLFVHKYHTIRTIKSLFDVNIETHNNFEKQKKVTTLNSYKLPRSYTSSFGSLQSHDVPNHNTFQLLGTYASVTKVLWRRIAAMSSLQDLLPSYYYQPTS